MSDHYASLRNTGFHSLGVDPTSWAGVPRTVVVLGVARGGTSIVAGALHHLGVWMGEDARDPVYEDHRMSEALQSGSWKRVREVVARNDDRHEVWGFKRPDVVRDARDLGWLRHPARALQRLSPDADAIAQYNFSRFVAGLRRPLFVIPFKDVFSVANRNRISMNLDLVDNMAEAVRHYRSIVRLIRRSSPNALLISADKAVERRDELVDQLVDFIQLTPSASQQQAALDFVTRDPRSYLVQAKTGSCVGFLDRVDEDAVSGWAHHRAHERPVTVVLRIDGEEVARTCADVFRQDLLDQARHSTGRAGFAFTNFDASLLREGAEVRVYVDGDTADLSGSPCHFRAG